MSTYDARYFIFVVNDDQVYRMGINDKCKWEKFPAYKEARIHIRCVKDKN